MKISDQITKIANTESRIFINGPIGSGKELIARKIHKLSHRNKSPFVVLNGALLDVKKYELELFGEETEKGTIIYGALEKANSGILLIDEVSEIPLETQSKILRVLIDQKFKRINSNHDINVDVRIICSTNKNIKNEIEKGNFREDLFHRLNVFQIDIEPLSKRLSDIPLLINYFSKKISEAYNLSELKIDTNNHYLINYNWPGNVRELRNLIERIAILSPNSEEKISNIINESLKNSNDDDYDDQYKVKNTLSVPMKEAREIFEKKYLTTQLKKFAGNISKTAKFIGMERSALHRKLKGLGVKGLN
jgi:two-component system nitrogen regulation response regulator NtrX